MDSCPAHRQVATRQIVFAAQPRGRISFQELLTAELPRLKSPSLQRLQMPFLILLASVYSQSFCNPLVTFGKQHMRELLGMDTERDHGLLPWLLPCLRLGGYAVLVSLIVIRIKVLPLTKPAMGPSKGSIWDL